MVFSHFLVLFSHFWYYFHTFDIIFTLLILFSQLCRIIFTLLLLFSHFWYYFHTFCYYFHTFCYYFHTLFHCVIAASNKPRCTLGRAKIAYILTDVHATKFALSQIVNFNFLAKCFLVFEVMYTLTHQLIILRCQIFIFPIIVSVYCVCFMFQF